MIINYYYETIGLFNRLWISEQFNGGASRKWKIPIQEGDIVCFSTEDRSIEVSVSLSWRDGRWGGDRERLGNIYGRLRSEYWDFYVGPEWNDNIYWDGIKGRLMNKYYIQSGDIENSIKADINKLELETELESLQGLLPHRIISHIDYIIPGCPKLETSARITLKKFVQQPDLFHTLAFERGVVLIEKKWNLENIDPLGRKMYNKSILRDSLGYFIQPLRVLFLSWEIRNFFPKCLSLGWKKTVESFSPFPFTPLGDLKIMIPPEVYKILEDNGVKEIEGTWWERGDRDGIWIENLKYHDL